MFKRLTIDKGEIYPTFVIATMSSGKSTLINALVGRELLPSSNRACTAKAITILQNKMKSQFGIHAIDKYDTYHYIEKATKAAVKGFNQTNDVSEMIIEGPIQGIKSSQRSMLLMDTPGINNSMDEDHELVTKGVLEQYGEGLILYVINVQQIGTYDDSQFLSLVAGKLKENPNLHILFVINKMDLIDPHYEDPEELMNNCKKYIESKGIKEPTLVPVSAGSALLFKKVLNGEALSELEEENFTRNYRYFKNESYSLTDYMLHPNKSRKSDVFKVDENQYLRVQIEAALRNTGFEMLERLIGEAIDGSSKIEEPIVKVKD